MLKLGQKMVKIQRNFLWLFQEEGVLEWRVLFLSMLAMGVGALATCVARIFLTVINFFTNLSFYGRISTNFASPLGHHLGLFLLAVPVIGGLIVGVMARYGSKAIRGHGIPEAMEQVLLNQSRIPARVMVLKLVSSAISIGTGGPFGAEGPIIATGGALGSLVGQVLKTTADERKTILAAGAAAGMAATFGSPVSAAILAIELLLFEYHARSFIPVSLASVTAAGLRAHLIGITPMFTMSPIALQSFHAIIYYVFLGLLIGFSSVIITRATYLVEDGFEKLPFHWMWWPALGGIAVGVIGFFFPRTLGVGYDNIQGILGGDLSLKLLLALCFFKFLSWVIALGSGTSGGTLAPLFTIGGALGAIVGTVLMRVFPHSGADSRVSALVGMAAIFAGSSRAVLASIIFAFETTHQPMVLLPLLGGCTASYLVSCLLMQNSIMTEKIERRGVRVPMGYSMDFLSHALVKDYASHPEVQTPKELLERSPNSIRGSQTLREAANRMLERGVDCLPVLDDNDAAVGLISIRDIFFAHKRTIADATRFEKTLFNGNKGS